MLISTSYLDEAELVQVNALLGAIRSPLSRSNVTQKSVKLVINLRLGMYIIMEACHTA